MLRSFVSEISLKKKKKKKKREKKKEINASKIYSPVGNLGERAKLNKKATMTLFIHSFIVHETDRVQNHDAEDKNTISVAGSLALQGR